MKKNACIIILLVMLMCSGCISSTETPPPETTPPPGNGGYLSFSSFVLPDISYRPSLATYTFEPENVDDFFLSASQRSLLEAQGFFIGQTGSDILFHEYYEALADRGTPVFVTSDALLHTFHILYDYSLRQIEQAYFYDEIVALTEALILTSEQYARESTGAVRDAAQANTAFLTVALLLLCPDHARASTAPESVYEELALIDAASGIAVSPLFGYREDYSQYRPRGHYTRTEELGRYFQAMMWYGRMSHLLKEQEQTRAAIILCRSLMDTTVAGEPALDAWERVYRTTAFYVGDADDLTVYQYAEVMEAVYGQECTLARIGDDALLAEFIERAQDLPDPRINSSVITDQQTVEDDTKGYRFMGQRFILDSYFFFELVYDNVLFHEEDGEPFTLVYSDAGPIRGFPRGLDILSVLGFEVAEAILVEEGDTAYQGYDEQIAALRDEVASFSLDDWGKNLYTSWLYTLAAYDLADREGYPAFMRSDAWLRKELATALGSWAELRHDTILYAKQSYTVEATSMPVASSPYLGYVEPVPEVYRRLQALTDMTRDGLMIRGLLIPEIGERLEALSDLLGFLIDVSVKELEGVPLSEEESYRVTHIGGALEYLTTFSADFDTLQTEADESVAVIADVHTDVNSQQVLEEGVGYPLPLYVVLHQDGVTYLAQGAVFSYYEFRHPLSDRLTDEAWQDLLASGFGPGLPGWMEDALG